MEEDNKEIPVTVGDWLVTMLIMCIPFVNFIMLFVWAFKEGVKPSKASWAQASLLVMVIFLVVSILFVIATAIFVPGYICGPSLI